MTLKSETTVEYHFNDPYLFFCKHHDTLGISESHGDSIQLNGIDENKINDFIKTYFEYVLENEELVHLFENVLGDSKYAGRFKEKEEV
tara:strand:- start:232 stop:495 length:264 start_codon:yes stop_codon:yes gene_type:complete